MTAVAQRVQVLARTAGPDALASALEQATRALPSDVEVEIGVPALPGDFGLCLGLTIRRRSIDSFFDRFDTLREVLRGLDALVIAGDVHEIIPGSSGPLRVTFPVSRLANLTPQAFRDYWLHKHVVIPKSIPGFHSYTQLHADPAVTMLSAARLAVRPSDYDGCALVGHIDLAEFERVMSDPIFVEKAQPDMATFVDMERSSFNLFRLINS